MQHIEAEVKRIWQAIDDAAAGISRLTEPELSVRGCSSAGVRHLLNNVARGQRHLELGTATGSTMLAAATDNDDGIVVSVDNFHACRDHYPKKTNWLNKAELREHILRNSAARGRCCVRFIGANHWTVDHALLAPYGPFTTYFYDGDHRHTSQANAVSQWQDVLADVFTLVVDDYDRRAVQRGTARGIKRAGLTIHRWWHLPAREPDKRPRERQWYCGLGVFVLSKPP